MLISIAGGIRVCTVIMLLSLLAGCQQVQSRVENPAGSEAAGDIAADESLGDPQEAIKREPQWTNAFESLAGDIASLPDLVIHDSMEIIAADNNLYWLLAAAGGGIALRQGGGDDRIADNFTDNSWFCNEKDFDKVVDFMGGPGFHFAGSGLWYLASAASGDQESNKNAWTMFEAVSVTGAVTLGLKLIINDDTPNGKSLAWPSGHTASSFTVASVLDEIYGPEVGIPAYIGAGLVGYRMMDSGDHWASDVLFGAVLGYIVGHHVANKYNDLEVAGFKIIPYNSYVGQRNYMGMGLVRKF